MSSRKSIRAKERDAILQSIRAGVVPRIGLHHIQVGRFAEVQEMLKDIERISDGGSTVRFIIGEYGAGKTFFLHLVRTIAHEKGVTTCYADLNPDRRIHATGGQAKNLYSELIRNISTRTKPDGGAIISIVERFISQSLEESNSNGVTVETILNSKFESIKELVGGYDFAEVIKSYWKGHDSGNEQLKSDAIRWLRGEFNTKTDARLALGVRNIIDDSNVYDHLKLLSKFIRLAGYNGLLVCYDEMVNLYKLNNSQARKSNYEQILRIFNDSLQGISEGIGFLLLGTPDFLMDSRKGLYSYEALQTRLAENTFAKEAGVIDYSGPVVRLANLAPEDVYVLLQKIANIFAYGNESNVLIDSNGIESFLSHCSNKIGDSYFRTPRNTVKAFVDLLSVIENNKEIKWDSLIEKVNIVKDEEKDELEEEGLSNSEINEKEEDNGLTSFRI